MTEDEADTLITELVKRSQELGRGQCCLAPTWRGHLCPYHEGTEDGADAALRAIGAIS